MKLRQKILEYAEKRSSGDNKVILPVVSSEYSVEEIEIEARQLENTGLIEIEEKNSLVVGAGLKCDIVGLTNQGRKTLEYLRNQKELASSQHVAEIPPIEKDTLTGTADSVKLPAEKPRQEPKLTKVISLTDTKEEITEENKEHPIDLKKRSLTALRYLALDIEFGDFELAKKIVDIWSNRPCHQYSLDISLEKLKNDLMRINPEIASEIDDLFSRMCYPDTESKEKTISFYKDRDISKGIDLS